MIRGKSKRKTASAFGVSVLSNDVRGVRTTIERPRHTRRGIHLVPAHKRDTTSRIDAADTKKINRVFNNRKRGVLKKLDANKERTGAQHLLFQYNPTSSRLYVSSSDIFGVFMNHSQVTGFITDVIANFYDKPVHVRYPTGKSAAAAAARRGGSGGRGGDDRRNYDDDDDDNNDNDEKEYEDVSKFDKERFGRVVQPTQHTREAVAQQSSYAATSTSTPPPPPPPKKKRRVRHRKAPIYDSDEEKHDSKVGKKRKRDHPSAMTNIHEDIILGPKPSVQSTREEQNMQKKHKRKLATVKCEVEDVISSTCPAEESESSDDEAMRRDAKRCKLSERSAFDDDEDEYHQHHQHRQHRQHRHAVGSRYGEGDDDDDDDDDKECEEGEDDKSDEAIFHDEVLRANAMPIKRAKRSRQSRCR